MMAKNLSAAIWQWAKINWLGIFAQKVFFIKTEQNCFFAQRTLAKKKVEKPNGKSRTAETETYGAVVILKLYKKRKQINTKAHTKKKSCFEASLWSIMEATAHDRSERKY